ncbi:MAG: LOG family protein [Deinococcus sp.]|nr:LOG family protein [Deinococcus sp.]MCL5964541.1 LOG family protein [Deinococcus sp.]
MRLITVFGSSRLEQKDPRYHEARAWGRSIAGAGFAVATGGYNGAMEAVSLGAKEAGGLVVGVTAPQLFSRRDGPNIHVDLELPAPSLLTRIERMIDLSAACLALPGGLGTLTEIMAAWNLMHLARMHGNPPKPLGVHASWMAVIRPGLEIEPAQLELITPIGSEEGLEAFLRAISNGTTGTQAK